MTNSRHKYQKNDKKKISPYKIPKDKKNILFFSCSYINTHNCIQTLTERSKTPFWTVFSCITEAPNPKREMSWTICAGSKSPGSYFTSALPAIRATNTDLIPKHTSTHKVQTTALLTYMTFD